MVEVSNGQRPNIGNFCTYCFHPFQQINELNEINCEHCNTTIHDSDFINMVPEPIFKMLKETRKIERHYVISFAFFGIFLSLLSGFLMVLNMIYQKILEATEVEKKKENGVNFGIVSRGH